MAKGRVIGYENQLPWRLPADLKHFRKITWGKPIVMGRKTYESIGRPLPGRRNIVVSRNKALILPGCEVVHDFDAVRRITEHEPEIMVIGGGQLYASTLLEAHRMYLTLIDYDFKGDAFFPKWEASQWQIAEEETHAPDEHNPYSFRFVTLERVPLNEV